GITIKIQGQGSGSESLKKVSSAILEESTTVDDLVKGLNNMGLGAEEIIDILKGIYAAGALQGELIIL
ncbi:MAG: flagellar basal body P-ring protein FlgI, partial [Spirochaetia bacterium]|nr:flagellar basal body P-ring protein FlgI [Spirochaetia bacterium]